MKARTALSLLLTGLLVGGLLAGSTSSAFGAAKATVVGTDVAGDWGAVGPTGDNSINAFGDAVGQDLVGAEIGAADAKTLNFVIKVNSLPPSGGMPEFSRYTWDFTVDGKFTELDGKFTNYSRGVCDPTGGACPPPRDPGMQPFFVRGNCTITSAGTNLTTCEEVGVVQATFDAAAKTITIPVPLALIKAKAGSKIAPAANIFGGTVSATPAAFVSSSAMPMDILTATKTFVVR
ncbi:MAG: hypothetical protein QOK47_151 [Actinomycetota bacterium]|nr:hypothetical protein [Actinomycetota bacterium]